eukprot:1142608-Pelagomonas_calceolata.AAC.7
MKHAQATDIRMCIRIKSTSYRCAYGYGGHTTKVEHKLQMCIRRSIYGYTNGSGAHITDIRV